MGWNKTLLKGPSPMASDQLCKQTLAGVFSFFHSLILFFKGFINTFQVSSLFFIIFSGPEDKKTDRQTNKTVTHRLLGDKYDNNEVFKGRRSHLASHSATSVLDLC